MAHNPFNDLYVDTLEDVVREARRAWEIGLAICNREARETVSVSSLTQPTPPSTSPSTSHTVLFTPDDTQSSKSSWPSTKFDGEELLEPSALFDIRDSE